MKESEGLYRSFRFLKRLLIGTLIVVVAMVVLGYTFLMRHVDARGAYTAASRELNAGIVSNDRFRDRIKQFPEARERVIRFMIVQDEVVLERRTKRRAGGGGGEQAKDGGGVRGGREGPKRGRRPRK